MCRPEVVRVAALVSGAVLLAGCSGTAPHTEVTAKHTGLRYLSLPHGTPKPTAVRDCASSGQHGVTDQSLRQALAIGPIFLGGLGAELSRSGLGQTRGVRGRYPVLESIAVLKAGATAVVAVPPDQRGDVALIYDKSKFRNDGLYR
jgi:hypothetical protein